MAKKSDAVAMTAREYVRELVEATSQMVWVFREFSTARMRRQSLVVVTLTGVTLATAYLIAYFVGRVADAAQVKSTDMVKHYIGYAVLTATLSLGFNTAMQLLRTRLDATMQVEVHDRISARFFALSGGQHRTEGSSLSAGSIEGAHESIKSALNCALTDSTGSLVQLAVSLGLIAWLSPLAAMVLLVVLAVYMATSLVINQRMSLHGHESDRLRRVAECYRVDRFGAVERCLTNGQTTRVQREIRTMYEAFTKAYVAWWDRIDPLFCVRNYGLDLVSLGITFIGVLEVWRGHGSVGGVIMPLVMWSSYFLDGLRALSWQERAIHRQLPTILSLRKDLYVPSSIEDGCLEFPDTASAPCVEFRDVVFAYPGEGGAVGQRVLQNLNFTVRSGEHVGIIGESGSGKSTLASLLARFYDPTSGSVLVDGHDLRDFRLQSWIDQIAVIAQDPQVLDGTVRDNLLFGLTPEQQAETSDEQLLSMLDAVHFKRSRLTEGLDTHVGRNGLMLSGGEGQRLLIVAALLRKPKFMIIDEATSSLDSETEYAVGELLKSHLSDGVTVVCIAHRLSTIAGFDRYVVLNDCGSLPEEATQVEAEAGSFQELGNVSSIFKRLACKQKIDYGTTSSPLLQTNCAA
jgi:ABC-type multidrug transport system fused ATPase/permease subunit